MRPLCRRAEPFATVSNETMIQQLVPLSKALAAARNDAKETCEAIQGVRMEVMAHSFMVLVEAES